MNPKRLLSLDVFRGLTIAGMILVNDPGSWDAVYAPLLHADWHGCTPTDLVFPFFMFIVGVSVAFSFTNQLAAGKTKHHLLLKSGKRALTIFGLGLFLAAFPYFGTKVIPEPRAWVFYISLGLTIAGIIGREIFMPKSELSHVRRLWNYLPIAPLLVFVVSGWGYFDFSELRIPGVLQRIALGFFFCALMELYTSWKTQLYILASALLGYWALMTLVPVPDYGPANLVAETNLGAWLDRLILGSKHLWKSAKVWDPEGILSTLPAIGNGILGMATGKLLQRKAPKEENTNWIFVAGCIAILLGLFWDLVFPINKKIWTSSYVLYTAGIAMLVLALCYWLIDVKGYKQGTYFFVVFGANAISAYMAAGILADLLLSIHLAADLNIWNWIYQTVFLPIANPKLASLLFALAFVGIIWLPMWALYKNKVFIKV